MTGGLGRNRIKASAATRPPLTNYYRGQPKAASPFQKKAPAKAWHGLVARAVDMLLIIVLLFCLVYSLILKPNPKVITSNNSYRPTSVYQTAAAKAMTPIKDHSKITFDEPSVAQALKSQFPEIDNINVELPLFGQRPVFRLSIAQPEFLFANRGHLYLIADSGVVVSDNPDLPAASKLPVVDDQSSFAAKLGQPVLSASQVGFISQVVKQCQRAKVPIKSLVLPAQGQELDLRTKDENYFVKFYLGGDPLTQAGQFLAARSQFSRYHAGPSHYLDVRVAGKIYYE